MSIIQGNQTQFMNQTDMDLFGDAVQTEVQQKRKAPTMAAKPEP